MSSCIQKHGPSLVMAQDPINVKACEAAMMVIASVQEGVRLNMSPGYPRLTTGIPVGKPAGMETRGSELLVITGLHGSGFLLWVLRVLATSTRETKVFYFIIIYYITRFYVLSSVDHRVGDFAVLQA